MRFKTSQRTRLSSRVIKMWTDIKKGKLLMTEEGGLFIYFSGTEVRTWSPTCVRQALCHWATRKQNTQHERQELWKHLQHRRRLTRNQTKSNERITRCGFHLQVRKGILKPRWGCRRMVSEKALSAVGKIDLIFKGAICQVLLPSSLRSSHTEPRPEKTPETLGKTCRKMCTPASSLYTSRQS